MIEVRMHGRGGQGAVLASLVLAHAAHRRGYHIQVFPEFGVERRGVPVTAFARLDVKPIRVRTRVTKPDHVLILDPALAHYLPLTDGLKDGGTVVMNATSAAALAPFAKAFRLTWVNGSAIAAKHKIGTATAPIVNTTMVGAFAKATGLVEKDDLAAAMVELFGAKAPANTAAAFEAYDALAVENDPVAVAAAAPVVGALR